MLAVRRAIFGLAGGFAITDFYVNSVRLSDLIVGAEEPAIPPRTSNFMKNICFSPPPDPPIATLREDIETALHQHILLGALVTFAVLSFGGIWPILGSGAAIIFDGDDGADRYADLKDWLNQ